MHEIGFPYWRLPATLRSRRADRGVVPSALPPCRIVRSRPASATLACWVAVWCACAPTAAPQRATPDTPRYPLIPYPRSLETRAGAFALDTATRIVPPAGSDPRITAVAERWADRLRQASGLPLPVVAAGDVARRGADDAGRTGVSAAGVSRTGATAAGDIVLVLDPAASAAGEEGYRLSVTPTGVTLLAAAPAGLFYGLQTLRQLLPPAVEGGDTGAGRSAPPSPAPFTIPAVEIEDAPRFPYRGMHLDVGRHFFPVSFIKKYLDLMALYRFNTFHWHLTEDQGWRIEIEKYPRLAEVGGCRKETVVEKNSDPYIGDGTPYCGFYTQEQARDVVAYARERFITVIPEIEMPGHSTAALAAYPELACSPGPFEVATRWGIFEDIYCPSERTFAFLEDVLTEVIALFPGEYIHIGGDEAPKAAWEASALAQEIIRREGLADEAELQSWFIRRIERLLNARGRRLIGWDEILEGGLAPDATVMSWRGMEGGIEAARQGHDVVMTPTSHVYFDYYQGDPAQEPLAIGGYTPLDKVYAFEPVPAALTPRESAHVLGAQGNVWTEYMKTPEKVEYMVFPRLLALSEVVWSPRERRDWNGFMRRLAPHLERLDRLAVNYRVPDVQGLERDRLTLEDRVRIELRSPVHAAEIRYTLDGTEPTVASPRYAAPLEIPVTEAGVTVAARLFLEDGRTSAVRRARFARTTHAPAADLAPAVLTAGLWLDAFEGEFRSVAELGDIAPVRSAVVPAVTLPNESPAERFGLHFSGYIRVPEDGLYTFRLSSDDGARLQVAGRPIVDHDGPHTMSAKDGQIALRAGHHPLELWYFQRGGGKGLRLEIALADSAPREVPAEWLFHRPAG